MDMLQSKSHGGCDSVCSDGSVWENLPKEVVFSVLDKLLEPLDHARFATMCKRWSSTAKDYNQTTQRWQSLQGLPMLLIPPSSAAHSQGGVMYDVSERTMYNSIRLPVPANEKYCGFGHGWLASIDESLTNITLRKLFPADRNGTQNVIHLSPLKHSFMFNQTKSLPKVILSDDPTLHPYSYAVLAIFNHGNSVAYLQRQRDHWKYTSMLDRQRDQWKYTSTLVPEHSFPKFVHAIFHRNHVYLVNCWGSSLLRFDVDSTLSSPELRLLNTRPRISPKSGTYFVETTKGSLLLVEKVSARQEVPATTFKVNQLVTDEMVGRSPIDTQVLELNSIGDEALFVCDSQSMSVLASNFRGCQPNSIYYAYKIGSTWEMGIFSLESNTNTPLHSLKHCESEYMPFWITTSFKGLC